MIKFYPNDYVFLEPKPKKPHLELLDLGTFEAATNYKDSCCLNFASPSSPGGGYRAVIDLPIPIKTQEEDLFRRSNLPILMEEVRLRYPLKDLESFYCSDVIVTKDKFLCNCKHFVTSVITMPAVINPQNYILVTEKIKRIFNIATENHKKNIILGAWGCGVFNNDPQMIATLFKTLVNDFGFDNVVFAIPAGNNHEIFKEYIFP